MIAVALPINLIAHDEKGRPFLIGTSLRVANIAIEHTVYGATPEEIRENYPQVTLEQIHAALSYYYGHQQAMDAQIAEAGRFVDELKSHATRQVTRAELEARLAAKQETAS